MPNPEVDLAVVDHEGCHLPAELLTGYVIDARVLGVLQRRRHVGRGLAVGLGHVGE